MYMDRPVAKAQGAAYPASHDVKVPARYPAERLAYRRRFQEQHRSIGGLASTALVSAPLPLSRTALAGTLTRKLLMSALLHEDRNAARH